MKFISEKRDTSLYVDNIFAVVNAAKADKDPSTINATAGCFYNEEGKLLTYSKVYENEKKVSDIQKASYAQGAFGNREYNEAINKFVIENRINSFASIATAGGTGAISLAINLCLNSGDTILMPEIAWGNYSLMAKEFELKVINYDPFNVDDLIEKAKGLEKIFVVINSPCSNPCGLSYSYQEWQKIINGLESLNKELIILNDIAYIDYAVNKDYKKYFELFNDVKDTTLVFMAYSCSKAFSYYGQRLGSLIIVYKDKEYLDYLINQSARRNRSTYSSVNNAAMINIANVLNTDYDSYLKEKNDSVKLLQERANLFIEEAKKCGLEVYPYSEGFFVTIKMADNKQRDDAHSKLIENHIYTIKVNKGIRVGICSVNLKNIKGLANKIKQIVA